MDIDLVKDICDDELYAISKTSTNNREIGAVEKINTDESGKQISLTILNENKDILFADLQKKGARLLCHRLYDFKVGGSVKFIRLGSAATNINNIF